MIEDLQLPQKQEESKIFWDKTQDYFFKKFQTALSQGLPEIVIEEVDLEDFPKADWERGSPSFAVMYRQVEDPQGHPRLLIESAGGASALPLLGRFAHTQADLLATTRAIAIAEQTQNPDVIFAEIVHLPENRTGNILLHPPFRDYEIPFLGKSSLPVGQQITLQDLYVSVRNGEIILRSKRLNKIVVPRLSNAHNYSHLALPVYQFLCDLQHQGLHTKWGLNLGEWANKCAFFPRIRYQNVILRPATWHLSVQDIISKSGEHEKMGRFAVLAEGDNELLIDWQNLLLVEAWQDTTKNREKVVLKEFLYDSHQSHVSQFITIFVRQKESWFTQLPSSVAATNIKRTFVVGSEWLYFKLYGGVKTADNVLLECIKPLCENLKIKKLIDQWFFIGYADTEPHLRLRFHLSNISQIRRNLNLVHRYLEPVLCLKYLYKIKIDTYERELERYGAGNIEQAEAIFCYQSEATLHFLAQIEGDSREELRWQWAIQNIDTLLDIFEYGLPEKMDLIQHLRTRFAEEFKMDGQLKQQLDKKYRAFRLPLEHFLEDVKSAFVSERFIRLDTITCSNMPQSLLSDYVHMLVNRIIPTQQRLHEMVIYDFLHRHYESCHAWGTNRRKV